MMESLLTKKQNKILAIKVRKEAEILIAQGAKLYAVKVIKDGTGLGLKECEHIADCIHEEMIVSKACNSFLDHMVKERDKL